MRWEDPIWLLGLWLLPLLAGLLVYAHRRRMAAARRFAELPMIPRLMPPSGGMRPWIKGGLLLLGVGSLIVAAARPRFGVYFEQISARGVDLFVLLDVSRSMLAEDVAPNRLERAKSDIRDLLTRLKGDRVGLIAFAGAPALVVPLTNDQGFFLGALEDVGPESAPRGGSLIGDAIRKAIASMKQLRDRDQVLVLITDGEDHDSFPLEAAQQAADRGVKIFTVGLGDPKQGRRIPLRDATGNVRYLQHEGQEVWSRMDERLLKEMALKTSGAYIPAQTRTYDLGQIYEDHLAELARGEIQAEKRKRYAERFPWFVLLGLAALLAEMLVSRYPRPVSSASASPGKNAPHQPDAQARGPRPARRGRRALAGAGLLLAALLWPVSAEAGVRDAVRHVREGIQHFQRGQYAEASKRFAEADVALPDDPRIAYDRACAAAAGKDFGKATELFQKASLARDETVVAPAHYNLGCLAAQRAKSLFGEHPEEANAQTRQEGLSLLGQAVAHYRDCLRIEEGHTAARHNLEVLRRWIKHTQQVWAERDRQQRRQEMDLLQMLEMIQAEQEALRQIGRTAEREDDSPRRRQTVSQAGDGQRQLTEEIEPLKQKLREALTPPQGPQAKSASAAKPAVPDVDRALETLNGLADQAKQAMTQAADRLAKQEIAKAIGSQEQALDSLNDIYLAVAPFEQFLAKATGTQESLVNRSKEIVQRPTGGTNSTDKKPDYPDLARTQTVVSRWGEVLRPKAEQLLKQQPPPVAGPKLPPSSSPAKSDPKVAQVPDVKPALEKAIELGPKIHELTRQAAGDLEKQHADAALPNQEEALKLLREITELLPKQPQNDSQQPKDQPDKNPQDQPQDQAQPQSQPQPKELSQQQAEALMRKVRERDRKHREMQGELRHATHGAVTVEKDW
jgi:Ca-activated chloride channel family protein